MKKLLTLLVAAIITTESFAQTQYQAPPDSKTIGSIENGPYTYASLGYDRIGKDTTYYFSFQTDKYNLKKREAISFSGGNDTLNIFYTILKSVFTREHKKNRKYVVNFKLGSIDVVARAVRSNGTTLVRFSTPRGYVDLTEKQVDKVFGKS